ncbi:MAG: hypothetical protein ACYDBB_20570 [Armatimonadota bacterium]
MHDEMQSSPPSAPPTRTSPLRPLIIWLSIITVIAFLINTAMYVSYIMPKVKEKEKQTSCISNQWQIAIAVQMYAQDHGDALPRSFSDLAEYEMSEHLFACPSLPVTPSVSYGYNRALAGKPFTRIAAPQTVLVSADTPARIHLITSEKDIAFRHFGMGVISYLDGHVKACKRDGIAGVVFTPKLMPAKELVKPPHRSKKSGAKK